VAAGLAGPPPGTEALVTDGNGHGMPLGRGRAESE